MNYIKNTINIITNPSQVFIQTKENHSWLVPLIIIILITLLTSNFLVTNLIIPDHIDKINSKQDLSEEQRNTNLAYLNSSYHFASTYITTAATKVIYYPILAFFITLLPLFFGGKPIKYKYVFSAVTYLGIINSLGFLIDSFIKLKYGTLNIGLNMALIFNSSNLLFNSFLKVFNIFGLWQMILLILLISIYYNYNKAKSFFIIFSSWFIIKIISAYIIYLRVIIK